VILVSFLNLGQLQKWKNKKEKKEIEKLKKKKNVEKIKKDSEKYDEHGIKKDEQKLQEELAPEDLDYIPPPPPDDLPPPPPDDTVPDNNLPTTPQHNLLSKANETESSLNLMSTPIKPPPPPPSTLKKYDDGDGNKEEEEEGGEQNTELISTPSIMSMNPPPPPPPTGNIQTGGAITFSKKNQDPIKKPNTPSGSGVDRSSLLDSIRGKDNIARLKKVSFIQKPKAPEKPSTIGGFNVTDILNKKFANTRESDDEEDEEDEW